MGVIVKKKDGESPNSMVYRFVKKVQHSGVLREVKGRRFTKRGMNKNKRRLSAIHRTQKRAELEKAKKLGLA